MRSAPPRSRPIPRGARPLGSSRRSSVTGSSPSIPAAPPTSSVCRWPGASASDGPRVRRPVPCTAPRHERSMDLALTEGQEMLRSTARNFMEREAPVDGVVGLQKLESSLASDLWRKAARLGWLGIVIPAEYGGSGDRLSDAAVLYEELGRGPLPGPFFSSGVLGALTVLEGATEEQRRRILPGVASGERVLTVAITEPNTSWGPAGITLAPQGRNGSYVLNGTKLFVSDATSATDLVVAVRTGDAPPDVSLLHVDAKARGVTARRPPRGGERPHGQGRRQRGVPGGVQRGPRGARRHGRPRRVRAGGAHADVADAVPLLGRSALAQAPHGRGARVVTAGRLLV